MAQPKVGESFGSLGIRRGLVEVPETGVYKSADGTVSRRYRAGTRIPVQEARLLGIVPADELAVEEVPPLDDAALGEQYARCLAAAGYHLVKVEDLREMELVEFDPPTEAELAARVGLTAQEYERAANIALYGDGLTHPAPGQAEAAERRGAMHAIRAATEKDTDVSQADDERAALAAKRAESAAKAEGKPAGKKAPKPEAKVEPEPENK
jgi:hypothetical protein